MDNHWIESATLDGFRSLRNFSLEKLEGLNIFVGSNNSGKTSVLEGLSILANFDDPFEWFNVVTRRDFGRLDETRAQSIRWCFDRSRSSLESDNIPFVASCTMSCKGRLGIGTLKVHCTNITIDPQFDSESTEDLRDKDLDVPEAKRGVMIVHHANFRGSRHMPLFKQPLRKRFFAWDDEPTSPRISSYHPTLPARQHAVDTDTLNPYSYQINRLQVRRLTAIIQRQSAGQLLTLLQKFDPDIKGIEIASVRGGRPSVYIKHNQLGLAPLSIFGDALRRAVLLASTILGFDHGGILFIDEVETGIHVNALQKVFSWLSQIAIENGIQVFATTHSLEAIDAIAFGTPNTMNQVATFHLDRTPDGTIAKRFDSELLSRLRQQRGLDVR